MDVATLSPSPAEPHLDGFEVEARSATIRVATRRAVAACPSCGRFPDRVHSRYTRTQEDRARRPTSGPAPTASEGGRISRVQGYVFDITEHRRTEERLRQAARMEAVGRLAGGVAHDFNNILQAISGNVLLLSSRAAGSSEDEECPAEIQKATERAADLTQQLLAFGRKQTLQPSVVDINTVVADSVRLLRRLIPENVEIETHLDPAAGAVRVDAMQMRQVLMNLAVNARDAMPGGGRLSFGTVRRQSPVLDARSMVALGECATITVSDSGQGMDEEVVSQVFDPFFTTKPQGKGTGLGLSTVYGIVEQSGGHVGVESEPGVGTTFTILLPLSSEAQEARADDTQGEGGSAGSGTVLLVEDEVAVRRVTQRVLEREGLAVLIAADGMEGLRLFEEHKDAVDLLLTDMVMPRMSGPELAKRIRAQRPGLPIIFMSGDAADALADSGPLPSGTGLLTKPAPLREVVAAVREALKQTRAGHPAR